MEILEVRGGLLLALGIAGSGVCVDYEDSQDGEGRKDTSFAVRNYSDGLKKSSMKQITVGTG